MALKLLPVQPFKRIYPHLDDVKDWPTNQTARLLWDRVHDLEGRLKASEANVQQLVSTLNTVDARSSSALQLAKSAVLGIQQQPGAGLADGGGAGTFTPMAPDMLATVEAVKAANPTEFWNAHRDGLTLAEQEAFIRILALALYNIDPNFGLNGKRGTDTLSQDAVAYLNPTVPNSGCEVIDVIINAGSASPAPGWGNVTAPPWAAKWINPT